MALSIAQPVAVPPSFTAEAVVVMGSIRAAVAALGGFSVLQIIRCITICVVAVVVLAEIHARGVVVTAVLCVLTVTAGR